VGDRGGQRTSAATHRAEGPGRLGPSALARGPFGHPWLDVEHCHSAPAGRASHG